MCATAATRSPTRTPARPGRARVRRTASVLAVVAALAVPLFSLTHTPSVTPWPLLLGVLPWLVGKYLLCPLRWHALSDGTRNRRWHLRVYAEAELLGLLTPGHVGADLWRVRRLERAHVDRPTAITEVGLDRLVGAIGLIVFVAAAGMALPLRLLAGALGAALLALALGLALRRWRPSLLPRTALPRPRTLAKGVVLSMGYQASICALLMGAVVATGHSVSPLGLVAAFGAAQIAGAVPGPQGASPRDGALVLGLVGLGLPWSAAVGAVALKATLAWAPALTVGGALLILARRAAGCAPSCALRSSSIA